ncbi:hypothetical protein ES703_121191 [subsurface metagenome]
MEKAVFFMARIIETVKTVSRSPGILVAHDFPVPKGSLRERDAYGKVVG